MLEAPQQQMMGPLIAEVALVRAPDGVQLELVRRVGWLTHAMQPDWEISDLE